MVNRRRNRRFIKRCDVEFVSNGNKYRGISSNFALDGMFIRTNYPQVPGSFFDIILHLPDDLTSKLRVKVKRTWKTPRGKVIGTPIKNAKDGMGVEIIEKDVNYLHFIRHLLNRNLPSDKSATCNARAGIYQEAVKDDKSIPHSCIF